MLPSLTIIKWLPICLAIVQPTLLKIIGMSISSSYTFVDQVLNFAENIHDSSFFGSYNTVGKMFVMGKRRNVVMGRIVIPEYHLAVLIY